ncbi:MAG: IS21 family transposase [Sulfobacillus thermotolerans]|nr:IS21 family transposase [Sulfobacillus thermotolerans]
MELMTLKLIQQIKTLQAQGWSLSQIAQHVQCDRKTVRKYMQQEDFSPQRPLPGHRVSSLDPFKAIILGWLAQDAKTRYKQRHTAQRIHERLQQEYPQTYHSSYSTVRRFIQTVQRTVSTQGTLELVWHPGEAQVDFGEADVREHDQLLTVKFLVVTFPFSNMGYYQIFRGETAECVVQGLQDIFFHIGGVPRRLIFDNASGVGHRIDQRVHLTELFGRFQAHYGVTTTFCNPYAGYEKGNVENKVGYFRRHFFVPVPAIEDILAANHAAFARCEADSTRPHYKKAQTIAALWQEERTALAALPRQPFTAARFTQTTADGTGKIRVDQQHWYSTAPEYAKHALWVEIGAHTVTVYAADGTTIVQHRRQFGAARTESLDARTTLHQLWKKPGAWRNSTLREWVPPAVQHLLDEAVRDDLKDWLHALSDVADRYDFDHAIQSFLQASRQNHVAYADIIVASDRLATAPSVSSAACDLSIYDHLLPQEVNP